MLIQRTIHRLIQTFVRALASIHFVPLVRLVRLVPVVRFVQLLPRLSHDGASFDTQLLSRFLARSLAHSRPTHRRQKRTEKKRGKTLPCLPRSRPASTRRVLWLGRYGCRLLDHTDTVPYIQTPRTDTDTDREEKPDPSSEPYLCLSAPPSQRLSDEMR
jgi:hypothetical protein